MTGKTMRRAAGLLALAFGITWSAAAQKPTRPAATPPRLVPAAETKLIMEGFTHANYQGLERNLKARPADVETWTFVRGQALLVAESGNLLMMRPPRSAGETMWMQRAAEMREAATTLARFAADRDYERSKVIFGEMTDSCNRCHQTFRVPVRVGPPAEKIGLPATGERKTRPDAE